MPSSRRLIASNTLGSSAATVTFSSIPGTYTDLILRISARDSDASVVDNCLLKFNGDGTTTNYSETFVEGTGSSTTTSRVSNQARFLYGMVINGNTSTSNTFGNLEVYIPSYTANQNKPALMFGVQETNATAAYMESSAGLYRNTAAITSIELSFLGGKTFNSGSSFFLYGLSNT